VNAVRAYDGCVAGGISRAWQLFSEKWRQLAKAEENISSMKMAKMKKKLAAAIAAIV